MQYKDWFVFPNLSDFSILYSMTGGFWQFLIWMYKRKASQKTLSAIISYKYNKHLQVASQCSMLMILSAGVLQAMYLHIEMSYRMRPGLGDVVRVPNHLSLSLEEMERVNSLVLALLRPIDAESMASPAQSCWTLPCSLREHNTAIITEAQHWNATQDWT